MKKILFGCMVAGLALASCSNDEVVMEQNDATKINFAVTAANGNSRANADGVFCNNNKPGDFTVYGEADGAFFMDDAFTLVGETVTNTSGTRYWPDGKTMAFYAYKNGEFDSDAKTFDFSVNGTVASQADLIYAVRTGLSKAANVNEMSAVELNFRHALSQIVFKAKNEGSNIYVKVSGVTVNNVYGGTATYSVADVATTLDVYEDHEGTVSTTDPVAAGTRGTWSGIGDNDKTNYTATFAAVNVDKDQVVKNLTEGTDGVKTSFNNAMLLFPQTLPGMNFKEVADGTAESNGGVYFTVHCEVYNIAGESYDAEKDVLITTQDMCVPVTIDWKQGFKYVYTFIFGDTSNGWTPDPDPKPVMVPIDFTVTVDDFVEYGNHDLTMDAVETPAAPENQTVPTPTVDPEDEDDNTEEPAE